ncbi:MAG: CBS domain-containing protein [Sideroxyarcus sp.]
MAPRLNLVAITVRDFMAPDLVTVKENTGLYEVIEQMHAKGVRRLPVVDAAAGLTDILTLDDLIVLLAEERMALVKRVKHEPKRAMQAKIHRPDNNYLLNNTCTKVQ